MSRNEQYLLALYILTHRREPPLQTSDVAELLDRSPAAVTEMFQQLDDDGLVNYEPYQGAALTETGWERAATVHETYVTVSWFFRDVLELDSSEAEAMELAAVLEPSVAERLASELPCEMDETAVSDAERPTAPPDESSGD